MNKPPIINEMPPVVPITNKQAQWRLAGIIIVCVILGPMAWLGALGYLIAKRLIKDERRGL